MQEWITNEHVDANLLQAIRSGVIDTGRELARTYGGYAQPIACAVTEHSSLIGGATGRTEFNRLFIDFLWIAPPVASAWAGGRGIAQNRGTRRPTRLHRRHH